MSPRWAGPADDDAPCGEYALTPREEPTLRDEVLTALLAADFRPLREWPLDRGAFPYEVSVSEGRDDCGWEVVTVRWHGSAKGSARGRLAGAMGDCARALEGAGLVASWDEGGLSVGAAWAGTPAGSVARMKAARDGVAA